MDIEANRKRLSDPWAPEHTIESLWKRIKDCQDFANGAGEAIDDAVVICLIKEVLRELVPVAVDIMTEGGCL